MSENTKLRGIVESTCESGIRYCGDITKLDYYNLFCQAASADRLYNLYGYNVCSFLCKFEEQEAVMLLFFIPINDNEARVKNIAERVIEVVTTVEECLVTIDYLHSEEVKEDKYIYIVAVKTIQKKGE